MTTTGRGVRSAFGFFAAAGEAVGEGEVLLGAALGLVLAEGLAVEPEVSCATEALAAGSLAWAVQPARRAPVRSAAAAAAARDLAMRMCATWSP